MKDAEGGAERLITILGGLPQVLSASPSEITRVLPDPRALSAIKDFQAAMEHTLRTALHDRPVLPNSRSLHDYLLVTMRGRTAEMVRVLYLTGRNDLIRDEVMALGTLDEAPFYAREIIHRALDLGAANLVLAHNHPSGDQAPSKADVRLTKRLISIASGLNITVLDHVVVGRSGATSMRAEGMI